MPLDRTSAYEVVAGNNFTNYIRMYIEREGSKIRKKQCKKFVKFLITYKKKYKKVQFDTALFVCLVKG